MNKKSIIISFCALTSAFLLNTANAVLINPETDEKFAPRYKMPQVRVNGRLLVDKDEQIGLYHYTGSAQAAIDTTTFYHCNNPADHAGSYVVFHPTKRADLAQPQHFDVEDIAVAEHIVTDHDGRTRVEKPWEFPWSIHGHMRMEIKGRTYIGSGTMIGDRYVLTAGHNVYFRDYESAPESISFFPGRHGELTTWMAEAESFYVHPRYHNEKDGEEATKYDLGLVVLSDPIGKETGAMQYEFADDTVLSSLTLRVTGYPADKSGGRYMYTMAGPIKSITPEQLYYAIDTFGGESGGATYDDGYSIRGVHAYGGTAETGNIGTRLSASMIDWIGETIRSIESAGGSGGTSGSEGHS